MAAQGDYAYAEEEEEGVIEYAEYAAAARKSHQLRYSLSALRKDFPNHEFSKDCSMTDIDREGGEADNRAGVKVNIPAGAVSCQTVLSIRECSGPFDLPDGIFLASPMFLIGSSQPVFKQNAHLSMEHFVDFQPGDDAQLVLLTSPRKAPLRRFSNAGRVYHNTRDRKTRFGHVTLKHFSFTCFGILKSKTAAQPPKLCYRPVVYTPLSFSTPGSCSSIFSITLDHDIYKKNLKKFMKQHFPDDKFGHPIYYEPITSEEWKDGLIELRLPRKPEALREGYSIRSDKIPLMISKQEVDTPIGSWKRKRNAKREYELYPPRIVITTRTCGRKINISSELCVSVLGIEKVCQRFYLPTAIQGFESRIQDPPWKILSGLAQETECIHDLGERPRMDQLLFFKLKNYNFLNVPREIGKDYYDFGIILLQDGSGAHIRALEHELYRNGEEINKRILEEWLSDDVTVLGKEPVTWSTLIEVINNIGKGELAAKIRQTSSKQLDTDEEV